MSQFWNKIAKSYNHSTTKVYGNANKKIVTYTKRYCKNTDKILDIGCGTGLITKEFADYVKEIQAIDSAEEMINVAKDDSAKLSINNINWVVNDIAALDIPKNKFNVILMFNVLLYLHNSEKLIQAIYQQLPEGGYFISVTDCIGEQFNLMKLIQIAGSKLGLLPFIQSYTVKDLCDKIQSAGFHIEFSENVHNTPPNYYIVAKK